jgi:ATP-dependent 26S proteasome regulatory subunit
MRIWPAAEAFKRLGLTPPRGVLLHGPPGCSKTLLARAAATGSRATFIPLSCAQVQGQHWQQQAVAVAVAVAVGAQHRHCISRNLSYMLYES